MKIPWDETFMNMAIEAARRSHCLHFKVGAVIARMEPGKETSLSISYNGPPRGHNPHCDEPEKGGFCKRRNAGGERLKDGYCIGAHAEMNAFTNATSAGIKIDGETLFVTVSPCLECAKHIANSGLRNVIYLKLYSDLIPSGASDQEKLDKYHEAMRAIEVIREKKMCTKYGEAIG